MSRLPENVSVLYPDTVASCGPIIAVKLDDGMVLFSDRWSCHFDAMGLPKDVRDRIVDGGFIVAGKWERGGDLSNGLKPGETVTSYYNLPA